MQITRRFFFLGCGALGAAQAVLAQPSAVATTVAAAANLQWALPEVLAHFERASAQRVRVVYGASGHFYAQIMQGAPFHLFLSADEEQVSKLTAAGKTQDAGRVYAYGRIGLFAPKGSRLRADAQLSDLGAALRDGRLRKLAIANPVHAPYGMLARQALQTAGLWDALQPHLVYGENVAQAAQFASSGASDGGIIAQSLALAPALAQLGEFALIPAHWHQPLAQRMVLLRNPTQATQALYAYLSTPAVQAIMARHGFALPAR